jgi:site-specific DNA recombinase
MARHRRKGGSGAAAPGLSDIGGVPQRRCAIYTRKSTEEGLDQNFNSLDAQREACEAFVLSQRHEGWRMLPMAYDDGGYSGGTIARPGLQALLADVDSGNIDVVVVYKVDRLTRSLADFAKIVERFDAKGVSFVSVTQAFNTTTSMGRLTLNVLLSFAQFEREVGAERVRDKVAASRRKGMWMGGTVPLGYRAESRKLVIEPVQAERVRMIFRLYLELGSTPALLVELRRRGITTALRRSSSGRTVGGIPFGPGPIDYLLHNRVYVGDVEHRGEVYAGDHEAILDRATFEAVQERLAANATIKRFRARSQAILTARIFDSRGNRMSPTHANKGGVRYHYYVSRALAEGRSHEAGVVTRVPAPEIERLVLEAIGRSIGAEAFKPADALAVVERHLQRVEVYPDRLVLTLRQPAASAHDESKGDVGGNDHLAAATIALRWTRPVGRPRCEVIASPERDSAAPNPMQRRLVEQIQIGWAWQQELASGKSVSIDAIAKREDKHARSIRTRLSFAFLAPDIVARILDGEVPQHLTLTAIGRGLPMLWSEQRRMFGMPVAQG